MKAERRDPRRSLSSSKAPPADPRSAITTNVQHAQLPLGKRILILGTREESFWVCSARVELHGPVRAPILAFPRCGGRYRDELLADSSRAQMLGAQCAEKPSSQAGWGLACSVGLCSFPRCGGRPGWGLEAHTWARSNRRQAERIACRAAGNRSRTSSEAIRSTVTPRPADPRFGHDLPQAAAGELDHPPRPPATVPDSRSPRCGRR
jgi:hypothetical protein